jgi:hypothetical protein
LRSCWKILRFVGKYYWGRLRLINPECFPFLNVWRQRKINICFLISVHIFELDLKVLYSWSIWCLTCLTCLTCFFPSYPTYLTSLTGLTCLNCLTCFTCLLCLNRETINISFIISVHIHFIWVGFETLKLLINTISYLS